MKIDMKNLNIEMPSVEEIDTYVKIWHEDDEYEKFRQQEKSVVMLWNQYPTNTKLEEVLIKVSVLNKFYSTRIPDVLELHVAQHIVELNIDRRLDNLDFDIVDEIARVNEESNRYYSFATKYCSHHRPDKYPIYDSFVDKVLRYFRNEEKYYTFKNNDLKNYKSFMEVYHAFIEKYKLEKFSLREVDWYLWILGRNTFLLHPKNVN